MASKQLRQRLQAVRCVVHLWGVGRCHAITLPLLGPVVAALMVSLCRRLWASWALRWQRSSWSPL